MDIFPLIGKAIRAIPVERIFFPPRNPQAELAKFLEAERPPPAGNGASSAPVAPPTDRPPLPPGEEDGLWPGEAPMEPVSQVRSAKSQLTPEETLAYQDREIGRELWMLERHLAQGCRIPDKSGTPIPCDCCEKGGFIAALALEAIPIAERGSLPSEGYQAVVAWAEALGPKVTVDAIVSGAYDYRALSGEASALRKKLMGTLALGAMKSGVPIPGSHNPGGVEVELEEELFQLLSSQQRPEESMSETIARLTTRLVAENLLTPTQHKVLALAKELVPNKEIAKRLGMAPATVNVHMKDIRDLIGVLTNEEARAAFGKPTLRERVSFTVLRAPLSEEERRQRLEERRGVEVTELRGVEVTEALRLERQVQESLEPLVDPITASPSLETIGSFQFKLEEMARKALRSWQLARPAAKARLVILRGALKRTEEALDQVRTALVSIEEETLPLRKEVAERGLEAAIRVLRETLAFGMPESIPARPDLRLLTPERRSEIAKEASQARWGKTEARLERRARESLEALLEQVEARPSKETVGSFSVKLENLAGEVKTAWELEPVDTPGKARLGILRGTLSRIGEDIAQVRTALDMGPEAAQRGKAAIRILRENLAAIPMGLTKGVLTRGEEEAAATRARIAAA